MVCSIPQCVFVVNLTILTRISLFLFISHSTRKNFFNPDVGLASRRIAMRSRPFWYWSKWNIQWTGPHETLRSTLSVKWEWSQTDAQLIKLKPCNVTIHTVNAPTFCFKHNYHISTRKLFKFSLGFKMRFKDQVLLS